MKKLFLFFALVLTVGMNAWAGDYVATDYLNNDSRTRITRSPSYDDPLHVPEGHRERWRCVMG